MSQRRKVAWGGGRRVPLSGDRTRTTGYYIAPQPPHILPLAASPKLHGRPQYGRRGHQAPRPLAGRQGTEGTMARPRSLLVAPGVQHGAGGVVRREWGGWVDGWGAGKSQGEGQGGEQKVPLWSGREKRSALPNAQKPCW